MSGRSRAGRRRGVAAGTAVVVFALGSCSGETTSSESIPAAHVRMLLGVASIDEVQSSLQPAVDNPNEPIVLALDEAEVQAWMDQKVEEWSGLSSDEPSDAEAFKQREIALALDSFDCRQELDEAIRQARERAVKEMDSSYAAWAYPD